jgi:hypothetical protein
MTAQVPDWILFQNEKLMLISLPFDSYLKLHPPISPFQARSTGNWRGYVATWEIRENKLFLVNLEGIFKNGNEAKLTTFFPQNTNGIFADWVNETLFIPFGKLLNYIHMGFMSTFEFEYNITIKNGIVQKIEKIDNRNKPAFDPFKPPEPPKPPNIK